MASLDLLSTRLSWSFVLTRCCIDLGRENSDTGHVKCSRRPQVPIPGNAETSFVDSLPEEIIEVALKNTTRRELP